MEIPQCSAGLRVWGSLWCTVMAFVTGWGKIAGWGSEGVIRLQLELPSGRDGRPGPVGVLCSETHGPHIPGPAGSHLAATAGSWAALIAAMPFLLGLLLLSLLFLFRFMSFLQSSREISREKVISHLESCQPPAHVPSSSYTLNHLLYMSKSLSESRQQYSSCREPWRQVLEFNRSESLLDHCYPGWPWTKSSNLCEAQFSPVK